MSEMPNDREDAQEEGITDSMLARMMVCEVIRRDDWSGYVKWSSTGTGVMLGSLIYTLGSPSPYMTGLGYILAIAGVAFAAGVLFGIYRDRTEARDLSTRVLRAGEPSGARASSNDGVVCG